MPSVSYNGQSFIIDGRRQWILAASLQYARIAPEHWQRRIADAAQAGFNTIETACPWMLHEPRQGRFTFEGPADLPHFLQLCQEAGLRVILRPGPFIGSGFDGGGLPAWLTDDPDMPLRQPDERFIERAGAYLRKLANTVGDFQASRGGPILLVQIEHELTCGNEELVETYMRDLSRILRETGVNVPLINANDLWTDPIDTIDTWRGSRDLLVELRQLRAIQPHAPRLVRVNDGRPPVIRGEEPEQPRSPETLTRQIAEILAAGAQPIVDPFHGGTNFGFAGGRYPGRANGGLASAAAAAHPPLGEAGGRSAQYLALKRICTFAKNFGHVFADLDPDYQPVTLDPAPLEDDSKASRAGKSRGQGLSIVPLRGAGGRAIFVFSDGKTRDAALLLDDGIRLPVHLGDQPVAWCVIDADLHGAGRLDYANLCPYAVIDRSIVVLHGPARTEALLSVNGRPLAATVPGGAKPLVMQHQGLTVVICNQQQIDRTYDDARAVYVNVAGLNAAGEPIPADGSSSAWMITRDDGLQKLDFDEAATRQSPHVGRKPRSFSPKAWSFASTSVYLSGASPRYAGLAAPQSLTACGALEGYGWYRVPMKASSSKKRQIALPRLGGRAHLYLDGDFVTTVGVGPDAEPPIITLDLKKGEHTLVILAEQAGRFAGGNELHAPAGLHGPICEIKTFGRGGGKKIQAEPVDPFEVEPMLVGVASGLHTEPEQLCWSFTHQKKSPLIFVLENVGSPAAIVLNDVPIAWHAGRFGSGRTDLLLDPSTLDPFKRGKNELRVAPLLDDQGDEDLKSIASNASLYESVELWGGDDKNPVAFAKWESPAPTAFEEADEKMRAAGEPTWWRCEFDTNEQAVPLWLDTAGLSKGQVWINDQNLGRYFTQTRTRGAVPPQTRMLIPAAWLRHNEPNELLIFDEHGFTPFDARLVYGLEGDLDAP